MQTIEKRVKNVVKHGSAFDRLFFFIFILFLMSHLTSCLWIYIAYQIEGEEKDSWITNSGFAGLDMMHLYAAANYFAMQTLTTVGYGDLVILNVTERMICIFLQFVGVIFFSFAAGSLTNIIANIDNDAQDKQEKIGTLNRIQVDRTACKQFMRGEPIPMNANGWNAIELDGRPLGWVKANGRIGKNHLPAGARMTGELTT